MQRLLQRPARKQSLPLQVCWTLGEARQDGIVTGPERQQTDSSFVPKVLESD